MSYVSLKNKKEFLFFRFYQLTGLLGHADTGN